MSGVGDKLTELEGKAKDGQISFEDAKKEILSIKDGFNERDKTRNEQLKTLQEMQTNFESLEKGIKEVAGLNGEGTVLEQLKSQQESKKQENISKMSEDEKRDLRLEEVERLLSEANTEKIQTSRSSAKTQAVSELQKLLTEAGISKNGFADSSDLLASKIEVGTDNKTITIGGKPVSDAVKGFVEERPHLVETKQNAGGGGDSGGDGKPSGDFKERLAQTRNLQV